MLVRDTLVKRDGGGSHFGDGGPSCNGGGLLGTTSISVEEMAAGVDVGESDAVTGASAAVIPAIPEEVDVSEIVTGEKSPADFVGTAAVVTFTRAESILAVRWRSGL